MLMCARTYDVSMGREATKQNCCPLFFPFFTWAGDPCADAPGARRLHALKGLRVEHA